MLVINPAPYPIQLATKNPQEIIHWVIPDNNPRAWGGEISACASSDTRELTHLIHGDDHGQDSNRKSADEAAHNEHGDVHSSRLQRASCYEHQVTRAPPTNDGDERSQLDGPLPADPVGGLPRKKRPDWASGRAIEG